MKISVLFPKSSLGTVQNRVVLPFRACGHDVATYNNHRDMRGDFDIVFVHALYPQEIDSRIQSRHIIPFDASDGTAFNRREAGYHSIVEQCQFYAKMNYDAALPHNEDHLKHIAIPQMAMLKEGEAARKLSIAQATKRRGINMTVTPTAINIRKTCLSAEQLELPYVADTSHLFVHYCQRLQWLIDMNKRGVKYRGGLVFKPDKQHRMSLENQQQKWSVPLAQYARPRISIEALRQQMIDSAFSLCPSGNERISFRLFQIMSTGSIPITTDFGSKRMLIMPEYYVPVEDFRDVTETVSETNVDRAATLALANKRQIAAVNPRSLTEAFLDQLN